MLPPLALGGPLNEIRRQMVGPLFWLLFPIFCTRTAVNTDTPGPGARVAPPQIDMLMR